VRAGDRPRSHDGTSEAEQQILLATERLLETTALTDLSVAQILTEANVSRGTFYFYFSSKYGPVVALLATMVDQIFATVPPFTGVPMDEEGPATLNKALAGAAGVFRDHRAILRATVEHWHSVPELQVLWLEIMEKFAAAFAELIDRQRAAAVAPAGPPSSGLATALTWSSERMLYMAGLGLLPDLPDEDQALPVIQAIWHTAIYRSASPAAASEERQQPTDRPCDIRVR
jgi:AcrR family transcriptional regulator